MIPAYMIAMRRARFQAGQKHVDAGQKLRADGKLEEALQEFQKALITDPCFSHRAAGDEANAGDAANADEPGRQPVEPRQTPVEKRRRTMSEWIPFWGRRS